MSTGADLWSLMEIPADALGRGTTVDVRIGGDTEDLARGMAREIADLIVQRNAARRNTCVIVPVGPVDQYGHLARIIADESIDCSRVTFVNMDEYLDDEGAWIDEAHPLSFRGFMRRSFYEQLPDEAGFRTENRAFPDPRDLGATARIIEERGGTDACFGGIGLNGHVAFNEPRGDVTVDQFADLSTRTLALAPESRAHTAINLSCAVDLIPRRAVTVGMREILGARRLSFWANRPWQNGIVRQALHGPVTPRIPASYLQRHQDARLTVAECVAEPRDVRLQ